MRGIKGGFTELREFVANNAEARQGVLVDTNILFSASYELDIFNEDAENVFEVLADLQIPIYTNSNVRSEFLDLHRRVLIPECLIDLLEDSREELDPSLTQRLKSLRTRYRKSIEDARVFKLADKEIKEIRETLSAYGHHSKDAWEMFCANYLHGKIEPLWNNVASELGLNFIGTRAEEDNALLAGAVSWKGATDLVGKFGIGSTDAMILDLFFNSKFRCMLTSDRDIAYCIEKSAMNDKFVFLPDRLLASV